MTDNENLHECDEMSNVTRDFLEVELKRDPDNSKWSYGYWDGGLTEWGTYVRVYNFRYCPFCGEELK